jgi:hypothetical protein
MILMKNIKKDSNGAAPKFSHNKKTAQQERDLLAALGGGLVALYDAVDLTIKEFGNDGPFFYEPKDKPCASKLADLKQWVGQSPIACRKKLQLRDAIQFAEEARNKAESVINRVKPAPLITPYIVEITDAGSDLVFAAGWLYHAMQWYDGRIVKRDLPAPIRTAVSRVNGPAHSE